jgi:clan AA aspartic protease
LITGQFRDDYPYVTATVTGEDSEMAIDFVVDTAFSGDLILSQGHATRLGLTYLTSQRRRLATGEERRFAVYLATIEWDEGPREVEVLIMEGDPLLGTGLVRGMVLHIEGIEFGDVIFEAI